MVLAWGNEGRMAQQLGVPFKLSCKPSHIHALKPFHSLPPLRTFTTKPSLNAKSHHHHHPLLTLLRSHRTLAPCCNSNKSGTSTSSFNFGFGIFSNTLPFIIYDLELRTSSCVILLLLLTSFPCFCVRYNVTIGAWETGAKGETGEASKWYILDHSPQHCHIRR